EEFRWPDCRGRQAASHASGIAGMGAATHRAVAWCDGSHAIQRLDVRRIETTRRRVADGTPGADESNRRVQEEERQAGRTEDRRPGALRSAAGVLRGAGGDSGTAAFAALPQSGGAASDTNEEQNERAANGGGCGIQQAAAARQEVFHR